MTQAADTLLIYDGDCAFCRYCVAYACALTGDTVTYRSYQELPEAYGGLSREDYACAIQLFRNGQHTGSGAAAAFQLLALAGRTLGLFFYERLPGFAIVSEWLYGWVARHRPLCFFLARFAIGQHWQPPQHERVAALFLRCLALIYGVAFISFAVQAPGLIGDQGILPVGDFLHAAHEQLGTSAYWRAPTLLWFNHSDSFIGLICVLGITLSFVLASLRHTRLAALGLFLLYMSLVHGGQRFMNYQWDMLLLECGFLAVILGQWPRLGLFLYRWLLFRLMFLSGAVKLLSGDSNWWQLRALEYHFETQPLPTALAWYLNQLPAAILKAMTAATFFVELLLPFLFFAPRQLRLMAAIGTSLFQLLIVISGNYNFFNLLVLALCLLLLDDQMLPRWFQAAAPVMSAPRRHSHFDLTTRNLVAALILTLSGSQLYAVLAQRMPVAPLNSLIHTAQPLHISHHYGVFATMTTERYEIIIEGSQDGEQWQAYEFRYKPGNLCRRPHWIIPHQPRLDWQMWFASLGDYDNQYWLEQMLLRLGTGSKSVAALFAGNPFPGTPPQYLRARIYHYSFTDWETRRETGQWWHRELIGHYSPELKFIAHEEAPMI